MAAIKIMLQEEHLMMREIVYNMLNEKTQVAKQYGQCAPSYFVITGI